LKGRILLAGALAGAILILLGIRSLDAGAGRMEGGNAPGRRELQQRAATVIDTLLRRYGIDPREVRSWMVVGPGKTGGRVEQRVFVTPAFVSVAFNHDLNLALASLGAHVVATERTKENLVTMHVVVHGVTIRSIGFVMKQGGE
jgi:hypothetical protein